MGQLHKDRAHHKLSSSRPRNNNNILLKAGMINTHKMDIMINMTMDMRKIIMEVVDIRI